MAHGFSQILAANFGCHAAGAIDCIVLIWIHNHHGGLHSGWLWCKETFSLMKAPPISTSRSALASSSQVMLSNSATRFHLKVFLHLKECFASYFSMVLIWHQWISQYTQQQYQKRGIECMRDSSKECTSDYESRISQEDFCIHDFLSYTIRFSVKMQRQQ